MVTVLFCSHAQKKLLLYVRSPVVVVVEAKKEDINGGLGQCIAEMVAAQIFNQKYGDERTVYGTVTIGTNWVFLKLDGKTVAIDLADYSISNSAKILGILAIAAKI